MDRCAFCDGTLPNGPRPRRFCSARCRQLARYLKPGESPSACKVCGVAVINWGGPRSSGLCKKCKKPTQHECVDCGAPCTKNRCRPCDFKNRGKGTPYSGRTCAICGKTYKASYSEQQTCGKECGRVLVYGRPKPKVVKKRIKRLPVIRLAWCATCGERLTGTAHQRFCNDDCRRMFWSPPAPIQPCQRCGKTDALSALDWYCQPCKDQVRKERKARDRSRRRALLAGAGVVEPITLHQIAARDRWICGICGQRVPKRLKVPNHRAPTIDHIIPLAKGGDHSQANVQLAHFICNSRKADTMPTTIQLLLPTG